MISISDKKEVTTLARKAMDTQDIEQARSRILMQAQRVIEEGGFKYLSMRRLAAKLGVTATTIYRYFASKEELFLSLLAVGFNRLHAGIAARAAKERRAEAKLKAAVEEYIRFGIEEKGYYHIMFAGDYPECREYTDAREAAAAQEATRVSLCVASLFADIASRAAQRPLPQDCIARSWVVMHGFVSLYNSGMFRLMVDDVDSLREGIVRHTMDILMTP
jgi:AcrR family transcriptional regulator